MKTKFDVGDSVAIKGKVTQITILDKSAVVYCVHIPGYSPLEVGESDLIATKEKTDGTEA